MDKHAVVLGAGIAGLVAARVLADHYQRVTVLERDIQAGPTPRRGVPQGRHLHGLMDGGRLILEELFPGITADAVAHGAPTVEVLTGSRWYLSGLRATPTSTGLTTLLASRPLLESVIRDRLTAMPGVVLLQGTVADGLFGDGRAGVIAGVHVRSDAPGPDRLPADLVVDATGRASRASEWLARAGLPVPAEERIDINLGYSSRTYRHRPGHLDGDRAVVVSTMVGRRGGGAIMLEGDRWHVTLGGMLGDHPPTDHAGFEAFAATLPVPDIHQLIVDAEPLEDPVPHRFSGSVRRYFERLSAHPDQFLVLGDALCSFNPVYAQGMTVAAQQALELRACLREGLDGLPGRFYARAAPHIDVAWQMSTSADLAHPGVVGRRTLRTRITNAYVRRCHVAAHVDPTVARRFMRVANLVDPPASLFHPASLARVLRYGSAPNQESAASLAAPSRASSPARLPGLNLRGTRTRTVATTNDLQVLPDRFRGPADVSRVLPATAQRVQLGQRHRRGEGHVVVARAGVSQPLGRFGRRKRAELELGQAAARAGHRRVQPVPVLVGGDRDQHLPRQARRSRR